MQPQTLEARVDRLEQRVTILEQLPARVDALTLQVSQLREEMHAQFSASHTSLREEIRTGDERILSQAKMLHEDLVSKLALLWEGQPNRPRRT